MISAKEFRRRAQERRLGKKPTLPGLMHCVKCGTLLQETVTGCRKVGKDYSCSDCYFDILSDVVEANPVIPPRIRRRA